MEDRVERARISRTGMKNKGAVRGHCIGYTGNPSSGELHLTGSIVSHLELGLNFSKGFSPDGMRYRKIAGRGRRNLLFIIDTSGSMLSEQRLALVKGCVVSLLQDAYAKRTRVALVSYGGARARLVLPFTSSAEMAARRIDEMKGGGGTPLVEALVIAAQLIDQAQDEPIEIVLLSDGRYNRGGSYVSRRIRAFGDLCHRKRVPIRLIDAGGGKKTSQRRVRLLASLLHASCRPLDDLRADAFADSH